MQITNTTSNGSTGSSFDTAALFIDWTDDLDAKVEMPALPADADFLTHSLAAWTADQTNAAHIDNIVATTRRVRFRDQVTPDEFELFDIREKIPLPPFFNLGNIV
jgi:hypothetical protein